MMRPRPPLLDGAAGHRLERARLLRRPFVDVNDEAGQHHERSDVVQDVADVHPQPSESAWKPHRYAGDQE
jgi:hypothetical protein